ncbi:hypothetical protein QFC22_004846 [Naganishia vaughanmartiniae]|uniref:Uncharacterized protein n=2 Tax=Naganishia TaxID=1851509 RepID=A0ACC2VL18_9TREE|nr:hypothetical protein QFC21_004138 [Naganishia friedmannii]KAJ9116404.1 hypothetical protein QFC22_004846 [Naganishia vaughanmartiniae]
MSDAGPTDKQAGFLAALAKETGEKVQVDGMDRAEASTKIEDLLEKKNHGQTGAGAVVDRSDELKDDPFPTDASGHAVGGPKEPTKQPGDSDYLEHPEQWTTGGEPATQKQRGFLHVLAKQHGETETDIDNLSKSEASEKIDELKNA